MMTRTTSDEVRQLCRSCGFELYRPASNQLHFLVREDQKLLDLTSHLRQLKFYLVTVVANDERELEDQCFKIYYLFSHPREDLLVVIENALLPQSESYTSIYPQFPSVEPFEREIADLFGLYPSQRRKSLFSRSYLHECYPKDLYPLRRDRTSLKLAEQTYSGVSTAMQPPPNGELFLPVGPIHAGVIEPGHFLFRIGGEIVEELEIRLGYTHKGIERLFQTNFTLEDGRKLAECVSGDSSFAHALAYCMAAESLAGAHVPKEASLLRAIFLEIERIANHIGDTSALAQDVALDMLASEIAVLREEIMRLNQRVAGHRFLRGLNQLGGLILPGPLNVADILNTVSRVKEKYNELAQLLRDRVDFRDRTVNVGILTKGRAIELGVTGLVARASGIQRDFRLQHPFGPYMDANIRSLIHTRDCSDSEEITNRQQTVGDVFSRFCWRVCEVRSSARLIQHILKDWSAQHTSREFITDVKFSNAPNFEFGLGYVEGWRGDIVYWLMKDKFERIYRCKVRDPSTLNWAGLRAAVEPHQVNGQWVETLLADFPVINKSFNLSYSGNDL